MATFEATDNNEELGVRHVAAGNVEKHSCDFDFLLEPGVILTGVTGAVTSTHSTVSGAGLSNDRKMAVWFLNTTTLAEQFTFTLTVTTNDGQTLKYTIVYVVG